MKLIDTTHYQFTSLTRFMFDLGYVYNGTGFRHTLSLITSECKNIGKFKICDFLPEFISFQNACVLHNSPWFIRGERAENKIVGITINKRTLMDAWQSKLVSVVKLQRLKGGKLKAQSNLVRFVNGKCL